MKKGLKRTLALLLIALLVAAVGVFVLAGCTTGADEPVFMEEDTYFAFDSLGIGFLDGGADELLKGAIELLKSLNLLTPDTGMTLYADGTFDMIIAIKDGMASSLNSLVSLEGASQFDIAHYADVYAAALFPGFTLAHVKESFALARDSVGFELLIDFDSPEIQKLIASLETTGRINDDFELPEKLGFKIHGIYEIRTVVAVAEDGTETEYTAVHLGVMPNSGEPFLTFTLRTDENGKRSLDLRVEFLKLDLAFVEL